MSNKFKAKEILTSKGIPTVEVGLETDFGKFTASVPSGVSTGASEAFELKDADGRGVKSVIENIEKIIAPAIENEDLSDQRKIDEIMIQLDGTKNKSHLGANAILPVSIAVCRAGAVLKNIPLYKYIGEISGIGSGHMPKPSFNMIEGGKHAPAGGPAFQEFMVVPDNFSFKDNFEKGKQIYYKLKKILAGKFGNLVLSAEGAFAVPVSIDGALDYLNQASRGEKFGIAIDAASSSFYKNGSYDIGGRVVMKDELLEVYNFFISRYPIISIEDPFYEEDFGGFAGVEGITIFGDDQLTSNIERVKKAKEMNACNGLILKPNQIGTVSETIEVAKLAKSFNWEIMVSNRAGETQDSFIADLAVGISADFIKSGAPFPRERMAKYERLVQIEKEIEKK
jgi:enolase